MDYQRCSDVERQLVYKAFSIGFSDYAVPMTLGIDPFFERFLSLEGNALQDSFIALNQDAPVGVIFGGIRRFDGYRNLRCGALCVSPDLRGSGVGGELFRLFLQNGRERNCERLSLEVLTDNVRALRFYEKRGYRIGNKLMYFRSLPGGSLPYSSTDQIPFCLPEVDLSVGRAFREEIPSCHIHWQNETESFSADKTARCFAAYDHERLIGAVVVSGSGKIYFLRVLDGYRRRGVARALLARSVERIRLDRLNISMPDTVEISPFLESLGFTKEPVAQYEMFREV